MIRLKTCEWKANSTDKCGFIFFAALLLPAVYQAKPTNYPVNTSNSLIYPLINGP